MQVNFRYYYLMSIAFYKFVKIKTLDTSLDALEYIFVVELHQMCMAMDRPYFYLSLPVLDYLN